MDLLMPGKRVLSFSPAADREPVSVITKDLGAAMYEITFGGSISYAERYWVVNLINEGNWDLDR